MLVSDQYRAWYNNSKSCTAYNQWTSPCDLGDHFCLGITFAVVQYCSAPLLKVERFVSERFLKRSESSLNTLSEQKLQRNLKSKGSVANCMTDRASVHTGNASASEQFLHRNRILILVHTVPEQLLKRSKNLSGTV